MEEDLKLEMISLEETKVQKISEEVSTLREDIFSMNENISTLMKIIGGQNEKISSLIKLNGSQGRSILSLKNEISVLKEKLEKFTS